MAEIEATTDNDVAEVSASKQKFGAVEDVTNPIADLFSLLTAERMMGVSRPPLPSAPIGKAEGGWQIRQADR